jgi:hypothetical protein
MCSSELSCCDEVKDCGVQAAEFTIIYVHPGHNTYAQNEAWALLPTLQYIAPDRGILALRTEQTI